MASSRIEPVEAVDDVDRASINSCDVEAARDNNEDRQTGLRPRRLGRLKLQVPEPLKSQLSLPSNKTEWKKFLLIRFPIISWVWSYQPQFLVGDLIAGITISVMHIPQGMAYAALAELPPVYGLYTSFLNPMIYAIFGTSRHISVGVFAIVSLMVGDTVRRITDADPSLCTIMSNDTNGTATVTQLDLPDCPASTEIANTMAFMTGVIMILFGFLQLGFVSAFLSEPLVSGYTTGAAVHVFTSQLRHLVGVPSADVKVDPGVFSLPRRWTKIVAAIIDGNFNWAAIVISVVCVTFLILVRLINQKLWKFKWYKKLPVPIPSQLIAVAVATLIASLIKVDDRYDVEVVGDIPTGLPPLTSPKTDYLTEVITDAFVAVIVCYSVTLSLGKLFAKRHGYVIYSNQEFFAYGLMNGIGAFFSCFNASASMSRSTLQEATGGNTQFAAFISSTVLLVVLLAVGPLFERLPRAILASIIVVALQRLFRQATDIKKYYYLSIPDMVTWIVVFVATVFLGVDVGLGVGIGFALILVVGRIILPVSMAVGRDEKTQTYTKTGNKIPGILIFRFIAPLCFTNTATFTAKLAIACGIDPNKQNESSDSPPGCIEMAYYKIKNCLCKSGIEGRVVPQSQSNYNGVAHNSSKYSSDGDEEQQHDKSLPCWCPDIRYIIIDMTPVMFVDSSGAKMLDKVRTEYSSCGIQLVLAGTAKHNRDTIHRSGLLDNLGEEWLLPSIDAAIDYVNKHKAMNSGDDSKLETHCFESSV